MKKRELDNHHLIEIESLDDQLNNEIVEFNKECNINLSEFNEEVRKMQNELLNKHSIEVSEIKMIFEEKLINKIVKFSKNYYYLKNQEMNLVKQQS